MGLAHSPRIVTDGLLFAIDAGNSKSYPGSGTTWTDTIRGVSGTMSNGPTYNSADGGSIVFDGTDDQVSFSDNGLLTPHTTMSVWIKLDTLDLNGGNNRVIMDKTVGPNSRVGRFIVQKSAVQDKYFRVVSRIYLSTGEDQTVVFKKGGTNHISTDWDNFVMTYDGTTQINYYNGEFSRSEDVNTPAGLKTNGGCTFRLGRQNVMSSDDYFLGKMSGVLYYNRALTASEVAQNYNALKGRYRY
jgi:hypothetical protein